jgi:hypothetical protein
MGHLSREVAIDAVMRELDRAEAKFPTWPEDIVHAAAVGAEEAGELVQAALDAYYGRGPVIRAVKEAEQTAAMAIRFAMHVQG